MNKTYKKLMFFGMLALVIANSMPLVLRVTRLSEGVRDGAMGLFYGVAIGLLVMAIRAKSNASRCSTVVER